jgi:hypothetical protein
MGEDVVHHQAAVDDVEEAAGEIARFMEGQREGERVQNGGLAAAGGDIDCGGLLAGAKRVRQPALSGEGFPTVERPEEGREVVASHEVSSGNGAMRPNP